MKSSLASAALVITLLTLPLLDNLAQTILQEILANT